jgi:Protein of unknown function (DUF4232)
MVRRFIGIAAAVCLGAVITGVVADAGAATSIPRCTHRDLAGAIIDEQGALGSRFGRLILTNKSSRSCRTKGFIGGQLIAANGTPLTTHITRNHATPARTVVIRSGAAGALTVHWSVVPSGNHPCPTARWFRVTPPDGTNTIRVFFGDTVCRGNIDVGPVTDPRTV